MTERLWYKDGLQFECQRCGNCCSIDPGYVWVSDDEIRKITAYLEIKEDHFREHYTIERDDNGTCLIERANYDCVFFNRADGCLIYEYRPIQCRTWPLWKENIATPESWADIVQKCPGIGSGRLYILDEIAAFIEDDRLR